MKTVKVIAASLGIILAALPVACNFYRRGHDEYIYAVNYLRHCWTAIGIAQENTGQKPPITPPELLAWLDKDGVISDEPEEFPRGRDANGKEILLDDRGVWHHPVVLISYDGELGALGACGWDGKWDGIGNDDVAYSLDRAWRGPRR